MTAKEYLSQAFMLDKRIKIMMAEAVEYKRLANSLPSISPDNELVDGTRKYDAPYAKWIYKLIEKEREINESIKVLIKLKAEVLEAIDKVENDNHRIVLKYRYLNSMSWSEISCNAYASEKTVRRWHDKGLEEIVVPNGKSENINL